MILGIYGKSDSGKTTLIVRLIEVLREKNFNVGSVKNIAEPNFTIDTKDKDTWKHSKAGAEVVVARSKEETAYIVNRNFNPEEVTGIVNSISNLDILIVEGYWDDDCPKVVLGDGEEKGNTVLRYQDNFEELVDYIIEEIKVEKVEKKLPGLDCGKCGFESCNKFAGAVHREENIFEDCHYFSDMRVSLEVDGKKIPMGRFAKEMVAGTVVGMISSLKEVEEGKDIKITIER
jgi:molybdopterin-guanine dinucleotide biosynthesis protein B